MAINTVAIAGNLTRDGELTKTQGGLSILRITVAVNERRKNAQSGEWENAPVFVDCTVWNKRADAIARYMTKGTKVTIQGKLHYSTWEDRNTGQKRSKLDVTAQEIEFMSRDGQAQSQPQPQQQATAYATSDIPF